MKNTRKLVRKISIIYLVLRRNKSFSEQGSHCEEIQPSNRVLQYVPGPQKQWWAESNDKFEGSEQLCSDPTLQDVIDSHLAGVR